MYQSCVLVALTAKKYIYVSFEVDHSEQSLAHACRWPPPQTGPGCGNRNLSQIISFWESRPQSALQGPFLFHSPSSRSCPEVGNLKFP